LILSFCKEIIASERLLPAQLAEEVDHSEAEYQESGYVQDQHPDGLMIQQGVSCFQEKIDA